MNGQHPIRSEITTEEVNLLPIGGYEGKIIVASRPEAIADALKEARDCAITGFDTETRPVFRRGVSHPVALLQVALPQKVFLIRLRHSGMTDDIIAYLEDERLVKAGVAVRDDIAALQRLRHFRPGGFVELADLSRQAGIRSEGVKKLAGLLLGFRVSKGPQTSNWEADVLTDKQIRYAATDAWASLRIYEALVQLM